MMPIGREVSEKSIAKPMMPEVMAIPQRMRKSMMYAAALEP
jgi:hypothetical protein